MIAVVYIDFAATLAEEMLRAAVQHEITPSALRKRWVRWEVSPVIRQDREVLFRISALLSSGQTLIGECLIEGSGVQWQPILCLYKVRGQPELRTRFTCNYVDDEIVLKLLGH